MKILARFGLVIMLITLLPQQHIIWFFIGSVFFILEPRIGDEQ